MTRVTAGCDLRHPVSAFFKDKDALKHLKLELTAVEAASLLAGVSCVTFPGDR